MTIIITLLVQASTTKIVAQKLDVLEDENIGQSICLKFNFIIKNIDLLLF